MSKPSEVLAKIEEYLDLDYYLPNEMKSTYAAMRSGAYDEFDVEEEPVEAVLPAIEPSPEVVEPTPEPVAVVEPTPAPEPTPDLEVVVEPEPEPEPTPDPIPEA